TPSYTGQAVTFDFTVTGSSPTGTVTISSDLDGDLAGCTGVDVTLGQCTTDAGALATAGTHQLVASYSGDGANAPSDSAAAPLAHRVVQPIQIFRDDGLGPNAASTKALVLVGSYASIADALAAAVDGDEVVLGAD